MLAKTFAGEKGAGAAHLDSPGVPGLGKIDPDVVTPLLAVNAERERLSQLSGVGNQPRLEVLTSPDEGYAWKLADASLFQVP